MLNSWFALTMLAIEANEVVRLRLNKFAGGVGILDEADLMISEKIGAGVESGIALLTGASSLSVINRYRELVAANYHRLNSAEPLGNSVPAVKYERNAALFGSPAHLKAIADSSADVPSVVLNPKARQSS
jgi:hypothetical protein